jgi:hypothetical protein
MRGLLAHAQRVEIGHQMAPDPVGADQHQRADRIEHRALHLLVRDLDALFGRLFLDLLAGLLGLGLRRRPFAGQRAGQLVGGHRRPVGPRPGRALRLGLHVVRRRPAREELRASLVDRVRVLAYCA